MLAHDTCCFVVRILTRHTVLAAAMLAPAVASAQTMGGAYRVTILDQWGEETQASLSGFDIRLVGKDPSPVALLLPAVQAAREAARRVEDAACSGETLEKVIIEVPPGTSSQSYQRWELQNVHVKSYSVSGATDGAHPVEKIALNFEKAEWTRGRTGEVEVSHYVCSVDDGADIECVCDDDPEAFTR